MHHVWLSVSDHMVIFTKHVRHDSPIPDRIQVVGLVHHTASPRESDTSLTPIPIIQAPLCTLCMWATYIICTFNVFIVMLNITLEL